MATMTQPASKPSASCNPAPIILPNPASMVERLVAIEYDFAFIDGDLSNLIDRLHGLPISGVVKAINDLECVRSRLALILGRIDGPITSIVRRWEASNGVDAIAAFDPERDSRPCEDEFDDIPF